MTCTQISLHLDGLKGSLEVLTQYFAEIAHDVLLPVKGKK